MSLIFAHALFRIVWQCNLHVLDDLLVHRSEIIGMIEVPFPVNLSLCRSHPRSLRK